MKIKFSDDFYFFLAEIVRFISKGKPLAARKFKKDLINAIKKDLKFPFNYKKSFYYEADFYRDYVFNGYTITYKIFEGEQQVLILGIIKNKYSY